MSTATQRTYRFDLMLSIELDDDAFGRLKSVCSDDVLVGVLAGVPYAEFDREAPTLAEAILSAVRDVEAAKVEGLSIEGVQTDDPDELTEAEASAVAYLDALLKARRLASLVPDAREMAGRLLVETV
ncbi:MAG TPA: hypothetical protein VFT74_10865 [Isosphaeraceae bacterium]|nr:hypothetical protein [Isosphaeraceae bacterium]